MDAGAAHGEIGRRKGSVAGKFSDEFLNLSRTGKRALNFLYEDCLPRAVGGSNGSAPRSGGAERRENKVNEMEDYGAARRSLFLQRSLPVLV